MQEGNLAFDVAALSDRGFCRADNQDAFVVRPDIGLAVVADGFGGAPGGALAASTAVQAVEGAFEAETARETSSYAAALAARRRLTRGFGLANERVIEAASRTPAFEGMATTLAALAFTGRHAVIAHLGDSRVYRLRGGRLERLTRDHSVGEDDDLRAAEPDAPELHDPRAQRLLTRLVGMEAPDAAAVVPTRVERVRAGDTYLLCTDGLSALASADEIADALRAAPRVGRAGEGAPISPRLCSSLVDVAMARGALDNVTVVVMRFLPPPKRSAATAPPSRTRWSRCPGDDPAGL